jgi:hypothetical protein
MDEGIVNKADRFRQTDVAFEVVDVGTSYSQFQESHEFAVGEEAGEEVAIFLGGPDLIREVHPRVLFSVIRQPGE